MRYGGNIIRAISLDSAGKQMLGANPYEYFIYISLDREKIVFDCLSSFTILFFDGSKNAQVDVPLINKKLSKGDVLQVEKSHIEIEVENGPVSFLVSGIKADLPGEKSISFTPRDKIYKVKKPWGYELWLNGEHPGYALKEIFIKKGTKTSLQYHNLKRETNVLFAGTAKLHFKANDSVQNDDVSLDDLDDCILEPVCSVDVTPKILHRLEAVTDVLLYETSTPHLDDVIRVSDDSNRVHGKVEEEHQSS